MRAHVIILCAASAWLLIGAAAAQDAKTAPPELQRLLPKLPGKEREPVFWQRTIDFRDGATPVWLVGCGKKKVARFVALVDDGGEVIAQAPEAAAGYENGFVLRISKEVFAWVLTSPAAGRLSSTVSILLLEDPPTTAFRYENPVPTASGPFWNSVLYFTDLDDDGVIDVLVTREVHDAGRRTHENLLYRFGERRGEFRPGIAPVSWLAEAVARAESDPAVPRAVQYSLSYSAVDLP